MFKSARGIPDYLRENKRSLIIFALIGVMLIALCLFSDSDAAKTTGDGAEQRLSEVVSMVDGVGECEVMISYEGEECVGVIILCEGAESATVRARLIDLVTSLYGVGANRVSILKIAR